MYSHFLGSLMQVIECMSLWLPNFLTYLILKIYQKTFEKKKSIMENQLHSEEGNMILLDWKLLRLPNLPVSFFFF